MNQIEAARVIAARRSYVKRGQVEIDPHCEVAAVPTGIWVQAWVFVHRDSINTEIEASMPRDEDANLAVHYIYQGAER
jgi:hypothetical protein